MNVESVMTSEHREEAKKWCEEQAELAYLRITSTGLKPSTYADKPIEIFNCSLSGPYNLFTCSVWLGDWEFRMGWQKLLAERWSHMMQSVWQHMRNSVVRHGPRQESNPNQ